MKARVFGMLALMMLAGVSACSADKPAAKPAAAAPAADEPESQSTAQLVNTYWKLMTLGGEAMETPEGTREIHFVLRSEDNGVTGFSGCNSMMGSYELSGARIEFSRMGGTMMACVNGMEQEQKFHQLFAGVAAWKISGETLQLLDASGAVLATFESRYMK